MSGEYKLLALHLQRAFNQAAQEKGKERHARSGQKIEDQVICAIGRELGSYDYEIGQAIKKAFEAKRIHKIYGKEKAVAELYGAINYLCAACMLIEEGL